MHSTRTRSQKHAQKNVNGPVHKKRKNTENETSTHTSQQPVVEVDVSTEFDVEAVKGIKEPAPKLGPSGLRGITVDELARAVTDGALTFEGFNLSSQEWSVIFEKLRSSSYIYKDEVITQEIYSAISEFSVHSYAQNSNVIQTPTEKKVLEHVRTKTCDNEDNGVTGERYCMSGHIELPGRSKRSTKPQAFLFSWNEYRWALTAGSNSGFAYTPPHMDRGKVMSTTMSTLVYTLKIWAVFKNWRAVINATGMSAEESRTPTCHSLVDLAKREDVSLILQGPGATVLIGSSIPHAVFTLFVEDSCIQNPPIDRQTVAYCSEGICIELDDFKAMYEACELASYDKVEPGDIRLYATLYYVFSEVPGAAKAFGCKFDVEMTSDQEKKSIVDAYYNRIKKA